MIATALGIFIAGFSSILTGLNFIVTVHRMRAPGMTWFRMPLFVWSHYATALIQVLGTPVLAVTLVLVFCERVFHIGIFDPALGGDPVLFQHLFWFYSHPAVYIMILPAMGVISELISTFSRKPIFGYKFVAFSSLAIAVLGFLVWGHHLFVSTQSVYAGMVFSFLSYFVAIPSAIKVFNWTATLYKGSISFATPMLYAFGFIGLFTIGGLTGLFLACLGIDVHVTDTYFVVAHFHYIMVGGAIMGYLGGLHYWWPKMTGRMYPEGWAKLSALVIFLGFNLTFFPQFILGYLGMPRRYHIYPDEFQVLHVLSTAGASVLAVGYLMPLIYFVWSLRYGEVAGANPWGATGLEWQTASPPPTHNFDETPVVTHEAYDYSTVSARRSKLADHAHAETLALREQFDTAEQQKDASTLGMWIFLITEIMFFGGMFLAYTVYRAAYSARLRLASSSLNVVHRRRQYRRAAVQQLHHGAGGARRAVGPAQGDHHLPDPDADLGVRLPGVKAYEWNEKFEEHHVPGPRFHLEGTRPMQGHAQLFFSLYFAMTGLHALHMVVGAGIAVPDCWSGLQGQIHAPNT